MRRNTVRRKVVRSSQYATLLLMCGAPALVSCFLPGFWNTLGGSSGTRLLNKHPQRSDIDVSFGSGGSAWGVDEDEEDDQDRIQRRMKLDELLKEQDAEWKEQRRVKKLGAFANATSRQDVIDVENQLKAEISRENELKKEIALKSGIEIEFIEPENPSIHDDSGLLFKPGSDFLWKDMDQEIENEFNAIDGDEDGPNDGKVPDTVTVNGKVMSRESLKGLRVGSAGGWTIEIFPGDFVVHRKFGIGRFEKITLVPKTKLTPEEVEAQMARREQLLTEEVKKIKGGATPQDIEMVKAKFGTDEDLDPVSNPKTSVLEITYADSTVHVPIDRAYRLSRYRAGDSAVKPRLSRVRGQQWKNARKKVEENTLSLAQDVLALYATRETLQRQPFDPAVEDEVADFGSTFQFEPTPDQQKCFEDIENDMVWRSRPMDRLVCGDVGFGKTEVAMRAIYRCIANGKQAALLAPTGVLAAQHFKNVVKRMGPDTRFGRTIELLRGSTGRMSKAGKEIRERIESGEVEVVVGTHALLSNSVNFKDLGLLVVDEEQRFGVKQKERLKLVCRGVDVLTLSATPIPRTLQMSLSGIRDTSTIRSPPPMRKPTVSFVQAYSDEVVKYAIQQELDRGGQCFYVVPRIAMIADAEQKIRELFPGIRVAIAHSKMLRNGAEESVAAFAEGLYDVLLATTVIENGVDIPRTNTIIVQNSHFFGMSTLYQLRGRVGRSDQQAYAFFFFDEEVVTEQAALRLQAISELTELGSGFDIANRDLEIRGAGSLLGVEQSGMAMRVGYDMYMRMLKKSIRLLRGLDLPMVPRTRVLLPKQQGSMELLKRRKSDGKVVRVDAFRIPKEYIKDKNDRIKQETSARLAESTAQLVNITSAWKDLYGPIPAGLQTKLKTLHLHACTRRLGIDLIGLVLDEASGNYDCIMRSPGLRPRHWGKIIELLPRSMPPAGLDVVFPARFTLSGDEQTIVGGKKVNLKTLIEDKSFYDEDAENWDALDQEEVEAMKDISSAYQVSKMDDIDVEQYPRFVVRNFDKNETKAVDKLLKVLLPASKVVYEQQEAEKESARIAAEVRERQELINAKEKENEEREEQKYLLK